MAELIGIYGGTFDPPHLGHLVLAAEARHQLGLNRLLWMLTPQPPHKAVQPITPVNHRFEMLKLMLDESAGDEISTVEMDRPGPHYTSDSLRLLRLQYPEATLVLIIGGDSLAGLPTWHASKEIIQICQTLAVMRRPSDQINLTTLEANLPGVSSKIQWVNAPLHNISSSDIRQRVGSGKHFQHYLHPKVYDYIQRNQLYR